MAHGYDDNQDLTKTIIAKSVSNIGPPGGAIIMGASRDTCKTATQSSLAMLGSYFIELSKRFFK